LGLCVQTLWQGMGMGPVKRCQLRVGESTNSVSSLGAKKYAKHEFGDMRKCGGFHPEEGRRWSTTLLSWSPSELLVITTKFNIV